MAKKSSSLTFKNAVIDVGSMTITEINKDSKSKFDLMDVLRQWDGVEGITISFRKDSDIEGDEE